MRRFLFLDFDGVLNSIHWFKTRRRFDPMLNGVYSEELSEDYDLDPLCVGFLNKIVTNIENLEIVISSAWRIYKSVSYLDSILMRNGFVGKVYSKTPFLRHEGREEEIFSWLQKIDDEYSFVILDDEYIMEHPRFVQTNVETGLTEENVQQVIKLFQEADHEC